MKKILISFTLVISFSLGLTAQNDSVVVNKNGIPVLPEQGEIAIGMSMTPVLTYIGNAFNGNINNNAPQATFLNYPVGVNNLYFSNNAPTTSQIFAKYFLEDKAAARISFEYTGINSFNKQYVQDDAAMAEDPLSNAKAEDALNVKGSTFVLGAGYEMRRGETRLQGYYGASAYFLLQNSDYLYEYGNPISEMNPTPSSLEWGLGGGNILADGARKTAQHNGQILGFGLGAFLGVEYFVAPRMSIGAELGYGYMYYSQSQTKYEYEIWNLTETENKIETLSPGNSGHAWGTGNPSMNFFMMFHF